MVDLKNKKKNNHLAPLGLGQLKLEKENRIIKIYESLTLHNADQEFKIENAHQSARLTYYKNKKHLSQFL